MLANINRKNPYILIGIARYDGYLCISDIFLGKNLISSRIDFCFSVNQEPTMSNYDEVLVFEQVESDKLMFKFEDIINNSFTTDDEFPFVYYDLLNNQQYDN